MSDRDLHDLIGDDLPREELERLRRVHELLVAAGPPPELSDTLHEAPATAAEQPLENVVAFMPRRRVGVAIALAAALAAAAFFGGWAIGHRGGGFERGAAPILMRGTPLAPNARASLVLGKTDDSGNTRLQMRVHGLPEVAGRTYYELYLTRKGDLSVTCGPFRVGDGTTTVELSIPYSLEAGVYDGWVVTRERAGGPAHTAILMRTRTI